MCHLSSRIRRAAVAAALTFTALFASCLFSAPSAQASVAGAASTATGQTAATASAVRIAGRSGAVPARRAQIRSLRRQLVTLAMSRQGSSYVFGSAGPDQFDCSGLVLWVYQQVGITLPHFSGAQMTVARPVSRNELRRGDLLFYGPNGSRHVAMYIGKGLQIGANSPRTGIVIDSIDGSYWASSFAGAGRLVG